MKYLASWIGGAWAFASLVGETAKGLVGSFADENRPR